MHGFSENVIEILTRMNFFAQVDRMKEAKLLYQIIVDFSTEKMDTLLYPWSIQSGMRQTFAGAWL